MPCTSRPAFGGEGIPRSPKTQAKRARGTFVASSKSQTKKKQNHTEFESESRKDASGTDNDSFDEEGGEIIFDVGVTQTNKRFKQSESKERTKKAGSIKKPEESKAATSDSSGGSEIDLSDESLTSSSEEEDLSIYYKRVKVGIIDVEGDWKIAETGRTQQRVNPDYLNPYLIGFSGTIKDRFIAAEFIKQKKLYDSEWNRLDTSPDPTDYHKQRYFWKWLPKKSTHSRRHEPDAKLLNSAEFEIYDTLQQRIRNLKAKSADNSTSLEQEISSIGTLSDNLNHSESAQGVKDDNYESSLTLTTKKLAQSQIYLSRQAKIVTLMKDNVSDHRYGVLSLAHLHRMFQTVNCLQSREGIFRLLFDSLMDIKSRMEKTWMTREGPAQMELIFIEISRRKSELSDEDLLALFQRCLQRFPDHPWVVEYILDAAESWFTSKNTFNVVQRNLATFLDILNLARVRGTADNALRQEAIDKSLLCIVARSIILNFNAGYINRGRILLMAYVHSLVFLHTTTGNDKPTTLYLSASTIETICKSNLTTNFPFLDEIDGLVILSTLTKATLSEATKGWFEKRAAKQPASSTNEKWDDPFVAGILSRMSLSSQLITDRDSIRSHLSTFTNLIINGLVLSSENYHYIRNVIGRALFTLGVCLFPADYTWLFTSLKLLQFAEVQSVIKEANLYQSATDPRLFYSFLTQTLFDSNNQDKGFKAARHSLSNRTLIRDHSYLVLLSFAELKAQRLPQAVSFLAAPALGIGISISENMDLANMPVEECLQWWLAEMRMLGLGSQEEEDLKQADIKIEALLRYGYLHDQELTMNGPPAHGEFRPLQMFDTLSAVKVAIFLLLVLVEIKKCINESSHIACNLSYERIEGRCTEYKLLDQHSNTNAGAYISTSMQLLRPHLSKRFEMVVINNLVQQQPVSECVVQHWLELLALTESHVKYESTVSSEFSQIMKDVKFWKASNRILRVSVGKMMEAVNNGNRLSMAGLLRIVEKLLNWTEEDSYLWMKHYLEPSHIDHDRIHGYDLLKPQDCLQLLKLIKTKLAESSSSAIVVNDRIKLIIHRILMRSRFVHESYVVAKDILNNNEDKIEIEREIDDVGLHICSQRRDAK